jgi:hypothetical protein
LIPYLPFTFNLKAKAYMHIPTLFNKFLTNFSPLGKNKKNLKTHENLFFLKVKSWVIGLVGKV